MGAPELLTADEREVIDLAGKLWNKLCKVVGQGASREADLHEAVIHVHALQQFVLSQAAARAYPDLYRPLGGWPENDGAEKPTRPRHAWEDPDFRVTEAPHKHPDFGPYWARRANHARNSGQPVYVTEQELKDLKDSAPPPDPVHYWTKADELPRLAEAVPQLFGVPVEVDAEAALRQHARSEVAA